MTPEGLLAFRISAALVGAFRGLRVRVREGGLTVLEVGCTGPNASRQAASVDATVFRRTVLQLWQKAQRGRRADLAGLAGRAVPRVEVAIPAEGADLGAGAYRLPLDDVDRYVFATVLDEAACTRIIRELEPPPIEVASGPLDLGLRVLDDGGTAIRLICLDAAPADRDRVPDLVYQLLGACLAEEAGEVLAAGVAWGGLPPGS